MKNIKYNLLIALSGMAILSSCNKDLEQLPAIATPSYPTGNGVAATIAANPNDSLFSRLIIRSGTAANFNDLTKTFTIFAVDNAGMKVFINAASGGLVPLNAPDATFSGFISTQLRSGQCDTLLRYLTLGQKLPSASIGTGFPNFPFTSQIVLDPTQPFVRMPIFPVKGTPYSYVNNIPLTGVDQAAANGIIHHAFTVAAPPSATLKTMLAADTSLSYFRAAVTRADSGATGLARLDSLLNYGVTNMTVLAPNNNAFRTLVYGLVYSQVFAATGSATIADAQASGAVAAGPAFIGTLPVTQVQGIVTYHFFTTLTTKIPPYQPNVRVFSVNIPATPTFIKTLLNNGPGLSIHPGVQMKATYTGPVATAVTFTGLGTFPSGGAPFSGAAANVVTMDKHAVNGVFHIIDKVLLPQ